MNNDTLPAYEQLHCSLFFVQEVGKHIVNDLFSFMTVLQTYQQHHWL